MRISTQQQFLNSISNMQTSQSNLAKLQEQISTGKKLTVPSDDPAAAAQVVKLKRELAQFDKFEGNIDVTKRRLELEETVLTDLHSATDRMRELTIQAGSGALSDADRRTIATELQGLVDFAAGLMNTRDSQGEYLFSGSKGLTQPYEKKPDGSYAYLGDEGQRMIQVAPTLLVASNDSGQFLFQAVGTGLAVDKINATAGVVGDISVLDKAELQAFAKDRGDLTLEVFVMQADPEEYGYRIVDSSGNPVPLTDGSGSPVTELALGDLAQPEKVSVGGMEFEITRPAAAAFAFETLPEVNGVQDVRLLDAATAREFKADYGEIEIEFTPADSSYRLLDQNGEEIPLAGTPFSYSNGDTISVGGYEVTLGTPDAGAGSTVSYTIDPTRVKPVSNVSAVEISDMATYATYAAADADGRIDLQFNQVAPGQFELVVDGATVPGTFSNSAGTLVTVPGSGIQFEVGTDLLADGEKLSIGLADQPHADTTLRVSENKQNLLDTALDLAAVLEQPVTTENRDALNQAVADAITFFEAAAERNLEARTAIGARLSALDKVETSNADFKLFTQTTLSSIEDLDFAEAISRLKLEETVLQAAQATFARVQNLSLFNFLN